MQNSPQMETSKDTTDRESVLPMGVEDTLEDHEVMQLNQYFMEFTSGPKFSPMRCTEDCLLRRQCPYIRTGIQPQLGAPCMFEQVYSTRRFNALCERLEIADMESVDAAIVREFVNWEIMELRMHAEYSDNPKVVERVFRGVEPGGEAIYDIKPNPVLRSMDKASSRKAKLLQSLMATREGKAKHGDRVKQRDQAAIAAELLRQLEDVSAEQAKKSKLIEQRTQTEEITDAEFEVKQ